MLACVLIYVHMCDNYNVSSCNTLMAFCQVLPHGELMPSINSALPVFTKSKLNNLLPANCYWVTSANSLN